LLAKQPDHPAAHKFLGSVYLSQNKLSAAEREFLQQLEVNPGDSTSYLQVGRIRGQRGDLGGAADSFESGLVIEPDSRDLMLGLATIRGQQRRFDDAIALCEHILKKYPDDELVAARLIEYRKQGGL
jgi:cytochrome c-type biogenesis protein CcmH/NrfG